MNLVSMAMQYLGPVIISRIASSLGVNQGLVGKAITAALPAILAALAGSASRAGGASTLSNVLAKQDPGLLGNLGNLIGGAGQKGLVDGGMGALGSLLGGGQTSAIANAVGKFAGIDGAKGSSLIGMLAPVVLGTLAGQQKVSGLDAGGLANLLASQKNNIAAAMPAGFSDLLAGTGVLDSIGSAAKAAAPVSAAAPSSGGGLPRWLLPALIGIGIAYLATSYGCNPNTTVEKTSAPAAPPAASTAAPEAPVANPAAALTGDVTKMLSGLTAALGTIKDEVSAKSAVPDMEALAKQLQGAASVAGTLPADGKASLATLVGGMMPGLSGAIERVLAIPGVEPLLRPVLDKVMAHLDTLSKA
ncbi:MAG: DUF937 domain-containing protein [Hyphomicrobium sp.]